MRLDAPRIAPADPAQASEEQRELFTSLAARGRPILNIFRTLANVPDASRAFLAWGGYVLSERNDLSPRLRELAILRTGYNCGSGYEWTQHVPIGQRAGLSDAEIAAIKQGAEGAGWSPLERAILDACDQLHADQFIQTSTWDALVELGEKGRMDLVFTVGQYTQVSMMLNSFGVQLDDGQTLDPDLDRRS